MKIQFAFFLLAIIIIEICGERLPRQVLTYRGCATQKGETGVCVPLLQCPLQIFKDVSDDGIHNLTFCSAVRNETLICCTTHEYYISTKGKNTDKPKKDDKLTNDGNYKLLSPPHCGTTNVPQKGIVDGRVELGAWPWIAALGFTKDVNQSSPTFWVCVGALITSKHVLTAAHCTDHPNLTLYKVRLGQIDVTVNATVDGQSTDAYIEKIIPHHSYKKGNLNNDIAILRLYNDVQFSTNIQPICLPISSDTRRLMFVGHFGAVAGWGASNKYYKGVPVDPFLRQLQFPIVENQECQRIYQGKTEINPSQMCAGSRLGGKAACQGDSGGPLMWKKGPTYYGIGILSFGWTCEESTGYFNGFTRVTSFISWIEENIKSPRVISANSKPVLATMTNKEILPVTTPSTSTISTKGDNSPSSLTTEDVKKVYQLPSPPNCGNTTVPETGNNFGVWPWVAALGYRQNSTSPTQWLCAGHLITSRHVITVGYCIKHSGLYVSTVRLGIDTLHNKVPEGENTIDKDVENIILHPSYTGRMHTGDIAILKLQDDVPFTRNVQPICLPKSPKLREMLLSNKVMVTVTGWGAVQKNGTSEHQSLENLQIPIVGNEECNKTYARKRIKIEMTQLCAGLPRGSCLVASSDPLILPNSGSYYMFGLVSYALGCAQPGYPDIFTRITSYIDWIEDNIK